MWRLLGTHKKSTAVTEGNLREVMGLGVVDGCENWPCKDGEKDEGIQGLVVGDIPCNLPHLLTS